MFMAALGHGFMGTSGGKTKCQNLSPRKTTTAPAKRRKRLGTPQSAMATSCNMLSMKQPNPSKRSAEFRYAQAQHVVICHHSDSVFANRLYNALQSAGIRAWLDEKVMRPGDDIYEEVQKGIQLWDKLVLCASEASLTSWWVDSEIDRIFQKERELFKKRKVKVLALIPLMLDDFMLSSRWQSGKAQEVKSRLAADFRGWESETKFEQSVKQLISALRADSGRREIAPESKL
jgi:hypothetical protein